MVHFMESKGVVAPRPSVPVPDPRSRLRAASPSALREPPNDALELVLGQPAPDVSRDDPSAPAR